MEKYGAVGYRYWSTLSSKKIVTTKPKRRSQVPPSPWYSAFAFHLSLSHDAIPVAYATAKVASFNATNFVAKNKR